MKSTVALVVIGALVVGGYWFGMRKTAVASPASAVSARASAVASPPSDVAPQASAAPVSPTGARTTFTVEARHEMTFTLTPPAGRPHGWLTGHWSSKGKSAGIHGATDDSLIAFKIVGPDDNVIEKNTNHPLFGNFKLRFDDPGAYTLVFDNGGVIRSSARIVEIERTYQPD